MKEILLIYQDNIKLKNIYNSIASDKEFNITISDGEIEMKLLEKNKPDLILLDVDLKGIDGMELCSNIKNNSVLKNIIVIFYTDKSEDFIQISCFKAGADNFILYPVSDKVLLSRIKAINRRVYKDNQEELLQINEGFKLSKDKQNVLIKGVNIKLTKKEYMLLLLLTFDLNKVHSKKEILNKIWNNTHVTKNSVDVLISKVRKKIGSNYILNIKGVGYKFVSS